MVQDVLDGNLLVVLLIFVGVVWVLVQGSNTNSERRRKDRNDRWDDWGDFGGDGGD